MTILEFIATLPLPLTRKGHERANDVTLAKRIRTELALAVTRGVFPEGTKHSVRIAHYGSLTVEIIEWHGGAIYNAEYTLHLMDPDAPVPEYQGSGGWFAPAMRAALEATRIIAERHNYDNSDRMTDYFDVGYYLTVDCNSLEAATRANIAAELTPGFGALQAAAAAAAAALGPKATKSVLGRHGLGGASKYHLQNLVKIATRAAGRPVVYDKSRRDWFPIDGGR